MAQDYPTQIKKWDVFEVAVQGTSEGNPFVEQRLTGMFMNANENIKINGFYDGDGIYKIRFMPSYEGKYTFFLRSTFFKETLSGSFYVEAADEHNHGPVHADAYHFAYEDGTRYTPVGTTAYVWHLQDEAARKKTLLSLQEAGFNKMRFCVFPKHYVYNFKDPSYFPYEGKPMDASVLTEDNFMSYLGNAEGNDFDFHRFNPEYFRNLDEQIENLGSLGIEADLILFHPYDRWGFSEMSAEEDQFYLKYMIDRYAAYRNVWWSMANEWDLLSEKTVEDWENIGTFVQENDPYNHLRSIHNCRELYDHSASWITHTSFQRVDLYKGAELTDDLRQRYGKPVVNDEIAYEGDIPHGWGNITGEEMVRRFWETAVRGGYPGHGETYLNDEEVLWWSHGGTLKGESWKRVSFLKKIMEEIPGGIAPLMNEWDSVVGVPEGEEDNDVKSMYLYYYSFMRPSYREFFMDEDTYYHVDVIDTWNMTVEDGGVQHGHFKVQLGAKQYMAVLLKQTDAPELPEEVETPEETAEAEEVSVPEVLPVEEAEEQKEEASEVFMDFSFNEEKETSETHEEPEVSELDDIPAPFINVFASEEARAAEEASAAEPVVEEDEDDDLPDVVKEEEPVANTIQLMTDEIVEEETETEEEPELPAVEEKDDSLENTVKLLSPFSDVEDYMTATVVESTLEGSNAVNHETSPVLMTHESADQISEMSEQERADAEEIELPDIVKEVLEHSAAAEEIGKKIDDDDDEETGHWTIPPINFLRNR